MTTVNDIISQGQPWTDNDFPPEATSISGKNDKISYKKSVTWKRMSEVYPDADIFKNGVPSVDDIVQGQLGNCYYLSTLSELAKVPNRISNRFLTKNKNPCGIYAVSFFVNGLETPVIVDDFIPMDGDNPAFA